MAIKKSLYQVLQVAHNATPEVIAAAYQARLKELGESTAPEVQSERTLRREAFELLSDPARRKLYDEKLRDEAMRALASGHEPVRTRPANAPAGGAASSGLPLGWIAGIAVAGAIAIGGGWVVMEQRAKAEALRIVSERLAAEQKLRETEQQKRLENADWSKSQYERNRAAAEQRRQDAQRERDNARYRYEQERLARQQRSEAQRDASEARRAEYERRRAEQESLRRSQQQLENDRRHLRELEQNRGMKF